MKTESKTERSRFVVEIQADQKCISISSDFAIIGATGMFVRNIQLLVGTPVVIRVCRGQDEVNLFGTVCAHYADLGLAIQFNKNTAPMEWKLAAVLAA